MIAKLILFSSLAAAAAPNESRSSGNVVYPNFGAKPRACAGLVDRPSSEEARRLFASILELIEAQDPSSVLMTVDFTGRIWEWEPLGTKAHAWIRILRDADGRAREIFVTRSNYTQGLDVRTRERVEDLDDEIRRRLPVAQVKIIDDLESLRQRPWPTAGLLL